MAKCVVCAAMGNINEVDEEMARQNNMTAEYQGRTYYFDSQEHKNMFMEDPDHYLKLAQEKGIAA